jgi:hypothetical protein
MLAKYHSSKKSVDINAYFICFRALDMDVLAPLLDKLIPKQQSRTSLHRIVEIMVEIGDVGRIQRSYACVIAHEDSRMRKCTVTSCMHKQTNESLEQLKREVDARIEAARANMYTPSSLKTFYLEHTF